MIDLTNTTFIIPLCIESEDRKINTFITLSYICKYLETNIILYEYDRTSKFCDIAERIDANKSNIKHIFVVDDTGSNIFHRTKFLNEMLSMTTTPVVVNYDIDVLLKPIDYKKFSDMVIGGQDLVYPYCFRKHSRRITYNGRERLIRELSLDNLLVSDYMPGDSQYGHCQFFNTKSYIDGGMENEEFISWGPEDRERGYRFQKLGYKVIWSNDNDDYVYHIEHSRGENSSPNNPLMRHNDNLFETIKTYSDVQLREYYNRIEYVKKYKKAMSITPS